MLRLVQRVEGFNKRWFIPAFSSEGHIRDRRGTLVCSVCRSSRRECRQSSSACSMVMSGAGQALALCLWKC
ncbi:hypothetical protein M3J09_005544 [Ascochyta lentis]